MSIHDLLPKCESCGGDMSKLISQTSFSLKGKGWYATDYKNTKAPQKEVNEAKGSSKETQKSSKKLASKDGNTK